MTSETEKPRDPAGTSTLRVVIADDTPTVAEMLAELIAEPGRIEVAGMADSEASTVEAIRRWRPDAVVLDLQLKGGSGTDVIRAVRADPSLNAIRIMVTSNHTSPELKAACLGLGADAYFDKVKELEALTARLGELAAAKRGAR